MAEHESADAPDQVREDGASGAEAVSDSPEQVLAEIQAKAEENWDQYLRAAAELENARRRAERDLENAHKFALERFANELLPVRDSLEMGLEAAKGEAAEVASLREGMDLTLKNLAGVMEKFGISQIDPAGEPFNPEFHEAMLTQPSADAEPDSVLTVIQKGYLLNGRLLRPARVIVARAPEGGEA